jgi:hypothetical protein
MEDTKTALVALNTTIADMETEVKDNRAAAVANNGTARVEVTTTFTDETAAAVAGFLGSNMGLILKIILQIWRKN